MLKMDVYVTLVFLTTFAFCSLLVKVFGWFKTDGLRGPLSLPLLGSLPFLGKSIPQTYYRWWRKYGNIFKVRLGSTDIVVVSGYDTIKAAAEFENDAFSSRPEFVSFIALKESNRGNDQISFCPFNWKYLQIRKASTSALRQLTNNYRGSEFIELLQIESDRLCQLVAKKAERGEPVNLADDIELITSLCIFNLVYGSGKTNEDGERRVRQMVSVSNEFEKVASTGNAIDVMPWLSRIMPSVIAKMRHFLTIQVTQEEEEVSAHQKAFDSNNVKDMADYFVMFEKEKGDSETGQVISKCLFRSLKDLFFAGFGTTSCTLKWLLLYMVSFPDIQRKIHSEIDEEIGDKSNVDLQDSKVLPFTTASINEILRLTTIVPFGLPHATTQTVNFMGVNIEKDTPVQFNYYAINHDKSYWGDPATFCPDRFLTAEGSLDEAKCRRVASFGMGRRKCAGERIARAELFVMFTSLMKRFTFEKPEKDALDLTPNPGLIYNPKPFRVVVRDRLILP